MSHSWGLTVPPKLVHREPQDFLFLEPWVKQPACKDRHTLHTHARDTRVHRGQGSGERFRDNGREEGEACHSSAINRLSIKPGKL